ncbi:MAG: sortase-associated OmpA-like protein PdsO [Gammaproteobacteria bacterium]|nr:sortase-associated OmpA-like protein PdsO [Gammaproteobacteria bacterium]
MNKTIIAITLATAMACTTSFAADAEPDYQVNRQDAGLGIGLLAGAIAGGPIGFVVGGLIGAQTGQAEDYKQQLEEKDQQLASLRKDIALAQASKASATITAKAKTGNEPHEAFHNTAIASNKLSSTLATGMRIDVLFRTNSEAIEPHYTSQLQRVIAVMKLFPDVDIQLAGHADPRGPETDNLALSKRRIDNIRQAMIKAGITNTRIHATAWGERQTISTSRDIEAYAFDRRVVIDFINQPSGDNKAARQQGTNRHPGGFLPANLHQQ